MKKALLLTAVALSALMIMAPVIPAELTPGPLPNLTITEVEIKPLPTVRADGHRLLHRGMTYSFRVEIKNVGAGSTRGAVTVDAPYGCVGQGRSPNNVFVPIHGESLGPGEQRLSNSFSVKIGLDQGGKCTFRFKVDPDNVTAESDESSASNERVLTFEVP